MIDKSKVLVVKKEKKASIDKMKVDGEGMKEMMKFKYFEVIISVDGVYRGRNGSLVSWGKGNTGTVGKLWK